ncbi:hypothetical protein BpHYR1_047636 [Brachionus plicatilis]|uniref:Uncharacterized protein n=1 Tax=Brachionus plicatilis TaxID=10195 RepID=A0A3M7PHX6_BRAPC|nr:hypothetical protein BpHYR1_047636 [Brachionus plicatilis]
MALKEQAEPIYYAIEINFEMRSNKLDCIKKRFCANDRRLVLQRSENADFMPKQVVHKKLTISTLFPKLNYMVRLSCKA